MLKKLLLSTAFTLAAVAAAQALEPPTSADQCRKLLDDVTQTADPAKLGEEVLGKLDELMTKAETQCETGQFKEMVQTAEAIQAALTAKN